MRFENLTHFDCTVAGTLAIDEERGDYGTVSLANGADNAATLTIGYRRDIDGAVFNELAILLAPYECRAFAHALMAMAVADALEGPRPMVKRATIRQRKQGKD